jgi:beta-N-acetylhexosaminidase/D-alanyl-D-alanine dipeptidase
MPTDFDSFTTRARADYAGGDPTARKNRNRLAAAMRSAGFRQDSREWWHFQAPDWRRYPVEDVSISLQRSPK